MQPYVNMMKRMQPYAVICDHDRVWGRHHMQPYVHHERIHMHPCASMLAWYVAICSHDETHAAICSHEWLALLTWNVDICIHDGMICSHMQPYVPMFNMSASSSDCLSQPSCAAISASDVIMCIHKRIRRHHMHPCAFICIYAHMSASSSDCLWQPSYAAISASDVNICSHMQSWWHDM